MFFAPSCLFVQNSGVKVGRTQCQGSVNKTRDDRKGGLYNRGQGDREGAQVLRTQKVVATGGIKGRKEHGGVLAGMGGRM